MNNNHYLPRKKILAIAREYLSNDQKIEDFDIESYLNKFENDQLQLDADFNVLNFQSNLKLIHNSVKKHINKFSPQQEFQLKAGDVYNTKKVIVTFGFEENGEQSKFRFLETFLWLQKQGKVNILSLSKINSYRPGDRTVKLKVIDKDFFQNDLKEKATRESPRKIEIVANGETARVMSGNDDILKEFKHPSYNFTLLKEVHKSDEDKIYWKDLYDEMYKVKHGKSHRDEGRDDSQKKTTVRNAVYRIQESLEDPDTFLDWNEGYVIKMFRD